MSTKLRFWFALLILCSASTPWLSAQESPTDSIRLSRPIPVTIRMSNNAVVKTTLMGMDQDSIMTMNQQGRTVDYSFNKIRSLRSQDGSIFFTPSKDTASDLIAQLSTQQSTVAANSGRSGAHNGFTGGHGQMPAYPSPP